MGRVLQPAGTSCRGQDRKKARRTTGRCGAAPGRHLRNRPNLVHLQGAVGTNPALPTCERHDLWTLGQPPELRCPRRRGGMPGSPGRRSSVGGCFRWPGGSRSADGARRLPAPPEVPGGGRHAAFTPECAADRGVRLVADRVGAAPSAAARTGSDADPSIAAEEPHLSCSSCGCHRRAGPCPSPCTRRSRPFHSPQPGTGPA